jgi:hypothetical protein
VKTYFPRTYIAFRIFFNVARPVTETTHPSTDFGIVLAVWEKLVFAMCGTWVSVSCQFRQCSDNVSSCMWSEHGICYVNNIWEIRREHVVVSIKVTSISHFFICDIWNGDKLAHVDIKQVETSIIWKPRSSFVKIFRYLCKDFPLLSICHWNCFHKKKVDMQLHRSISHVGACDMWWNANPY